MNGEQLSFMPVTNAKSQKHKSTKVKKIAEPIEPITDEIKITCFEREALGVIIKYSITKNWAYMMYYYKDDPNKQMHYAYFNIKLELALN